MQARAEGEDVFAYAGSEFATSQRLKTVFGAELGLRPAQFRAVAYWRAQSVTSPGGGARTTGYLL